MLETKTFWYINTTEYENKYFESKDEAMDFLFDEANITFNFPNKKECELQNEIVAMLEEKYLQTIEKEIVIDMWEDDTQERKAEYRKGQGC